MATPYLSEIKIFSFNFAPEGWAFCNGQLLPINQNQALFSLLGTTYGGNGVTTFALPNLQGRVPLHVGSGFSLGQVGGEEITHAAEHRDGEPYPRDGGLVGVGEHHVPRRATFSRGPPARLPTTPAEAATSV